MGRRTDALPEPIISAELLHPFTPLLRTAGDPGLLAMAKPSGLRRQGEST